MSISVHMLGALTSGNEAQGASMQQLLEDALTYK